MNMEALNYHNENPGVERNWSVCSRVTETSSLVQGMIPSCAFCALFEEKDEYPGRQGDH